MSTVILIFFLFTLLETISCDSSPEILGAKPANIRDILFKHIENNGPCRMNQFRCHNDKCVEKRDFCDGRNDCGDYSDENYCRTNNECPLAERFLRCGTDYSYKKCVPRSWMCDGIKDCTDGLDEKGCGENFESGLTFHQINRARLLAQNWILSRRNEESRTQKWGVDIPRTSIAFYFSENLNLTRNKTYTDELSYELSISLLSKFALRDIDDIRTSELASYVNSFLAFCINPRKFYVVDLIGELRKRVDENKVANPYAILALCNAHEYITEKDIEKLLAAYQKANEEHRTDTQAIIIMALVCASAQPDSSFNREELTDYTLEIKKKQYRNGTVENIKTTALVLQALFASEPVPDEDNFDEEKAIKQILRSQEKDGSFGGHMNTYYVLPVLRKLSLANISGNLCPKITTVDNVVLNQMKRTKLYNRKIGAMFPKSWQPPISSGSGIQIENEGLEYLKIQVGEKWNISYSIWIGDDKILQRSLTLSVPANTSFYGVLEYAAGIDEKYKFEYNVRNRKPYIYALSGIMDDPEMEMFWYPYYLFSNSSQPTLISKSPADLIPNNNDHMLFWYRKAA